MNGIFLASGSIRLNSHNVSPADVEMVVTLFELALLRIPLEDRKVIINYWQTPSSYNRSVFLNNNGALPRVWNEGHRVNLSPAVLHEMGNEFAVQAILHELTHVYFYAKCEPNHWVDRAADMETKNRADCASERLVTDQMRRWGEDQTELLKWRDNWEAEHPMEGE